MFVAKINVYYIILIKYCTKILAYNSKSISFLYKSRHYLENYTGTHSRFREIYWEDEDEAGPSNMGWNSTIRCFIKKITIMGFESYCRKTSASYRRKSA